MKIRKSVLGLALSLACMNSAYAAVSAGGQEVFGGAQQPEGELMLSVFDPNAQITYTRDLGIDVLSTDFDSASFTFASDIVYQTLFDKTDPATLQYSIIGGMNDLESAVVLGVWFTSGDAPLTPFDTFSGLSSAHGALFDFTIGTNEATANPTDYGSDLSVEISDPNSTGYYANPFTSPENFGSLAGFSTAAAPGEGMAFYKTEVSQATGGDVVTTTFAGTWTLGLDGTLTYAADVDTDGDGISDSADNCTLVANADQTDGDADGIGNACDADFNNDCIVNVIDLGILRTVFFTNDAEADLNNDGVVNVIDLGIFRTLFFGVPGPSGLPNACSS